MKKEINKNTSLAEILIIPEAREILAKYKVPCLFCPMAAIEAEKLSIGEITEMYKLNLQKLLKDLNSLKE